jgi:hypothetical protein
MSEVVYNISTLVLAIIASMKRLLLLSIAVILSGCFNSKENHLYTISLTSVCKSKLFVEVYNSWFGTLKSSYLTDSVHFRKYMGSYNDETGIISYQCMGDSIMVEKDERIQILKMDSAVHKPRITIKLKREIRYFKLSELR